MDVLWLLIKDEFFRSNTPGGPIYNANRPETLAIVRQMRTLMDAYGDRVLIGEIYLPLRELMAYYGAAPHLLDAAPKLEGAQMPFNFHLILMDWNAEAIANFIQQYEAALPAGAWPNWVLGNHDQKRLTSRIGPAQARVAAVLLLTLRGTPTLYYGDELGMPDARISPAEVQDPAELRQPGMGRGRDPERSPMLWENRENAGFTAPGVKTWLPLVWDWPKFTVETQGYDDHSMLALYRKLLALRRSSAALTSGSVSAVRAIEGVLSYTRTAAPERFEIHLNLTDEVRWVECMTGRIVLSSYLDAEGMVVEGWVKLRGDEGLVVHLL
jgi:alpha-glucosidase